LHVTLPCRHPLSSGLHHERNAGRRDTLGNIPGVLESFGINIHKHLSGRNSSHQRKLDRLPAGTELLILFTDFLGHNVMKHFRQLANEENVRFIACAVRCAR